MKTHTRKKGRKQTGKKNRSKAFPIPISAVSDSTRRSVEYTPVTEEQLYEVQAIVDDKIDPDGQHLYKVRWKGCLPSEDTWLPEARLTQAQDPLNSYKRLSRKRPSVSASRGAKRRKR